MCGYMYKADSDASIKGKYVFSDDGYNIGTVISSLGNILIIEVKYESAREGVTELRYEVPFIEIENVIGDSIVLKSKKEYIQQNYIRSRRQQQLKEKNNQ